jgi:hypothetical protein
MSQREEARDRKALQAFAEPIAANATDIADYVFAAILKDVELGASSSVTADLQELTEDEHLGCADLGWVPKGALPWAKAVWCRAFREKLDALDQARVNRNAGRLERFVRGIGCDVLDEGTQQARRGFAP